MRIRMLFACLCGSLLLTATASAQKPVAKFPRDAASWLNSKPISEQTLKGKAALLYFYEET